MNDGKEGWRGKTQARACIRRKNESCGMNEMRWIELKEQEKHPVGNQTGTKKEVGGTRRCRNCPAHVDTSYSRGGTRPKKGDVGKPAKKGWERTQKERAVSSPESLDRVLRVPAPPSVKRYISLQKTVASSPFLMRGPSASMTPTPDPSPTDVSSNLPTLGFTV